MPANMMSEPAGSSLKVIGKSSATVNAGPMPGSTPTAVPSSTPISAYSRFIGCSATARPCISAASASMRTPKLVSWFRNSLHSRGKSFKRISEPNDSRTLILLVSYESEVRKRARRKYVPNFGFGTLEQAFDRADGKRQGQNLGKQQVHRDAEHEADAEIGEDRAPA